MGAVRFLDASGQPMAPAAPSRGRMMALASGANAPYDAADIAGDQMAAWRPFLWSPDAELNPYRDRIVSRIRDLVKNDGWSNGIVTRIVDSAIGGVFHPIPRPHFKFLRAYSGLKTFDAAWAAEYATTVKAYHWNWAMDEGRYCDLGRRQVLPQIYGTAFRHKMVDADALAMLPYRLDRLGVGRARYATCVQLIDPDRLSNPQLRFDTQNLRGGVEVDADDVAVGYHIRQAHVGDWFSAAKSVTWVRVPAETPDGRRIVVHDFDIDRAGRHRGGAGILAPVMSRLRMLFKYDNAEVEAALINAIFSAYIESPFDHEMLQDVVGDSNSIGVYQEGRSAFHDQQRVTLNGSRVLKLYPGEKMSTVNSARPSSNFADFEKAVLRNAASAAGISAQQASNDWSDVNYSSARGALLEFWKTLTRRRQDFATGFAQPVYAAWLEESMEVDDLPLPAGAPPFEECRTAYARASWMGPGIGWMDPVDEPTGSVIRLDAALTTHSRELADQGLDLDEVLEERSLELQKFKDHDIPPPSWAQAQPVREIAQTPKKPEAN